MVDWGEVFVKGCYELEGDGPLSLKCYETINEMLASITTEYIPNVRAIAERLSAQSPSQPKHEQWVDYARNCVKPGLDYFKKQLNSSLKNSLEAFKTCRLFLPKRINAIKPTAASLDQSFSAIPFFSQKEIDALKGELSSYLALSTDICVTI